MYKNFAYLYDALTDDIDYSEWADFVEKIFKRHKCSPKTILELGCGTGSFAIEMSKRGYEMICIDLSEDMLNCASQKAREANQDILFLNQDMTAFELYGTVDVVVCLLDSLNYITQDNKLIKAFKLVKNYLNPDGLFIFDVNTPYKFEHILADNIFYQIDDDITYIWNNSYNTKTRKAKFDLTFFVREGELYRRFDESHIERAYYNDEIENFLGLSGLSFITNYDDLKLKAPNSESNRIFYVSKK